jgi:hypothetical protein
LPGDTKLVVPLEIEPDLGGRVEVLAESLDGADSETPTRPGGTPILRTALGQPLLMKRPDSRPAALRAAEAPQAAPPAWCRAPGLALA